jgi:Spy/CpxP family protein refolding chaperone
MPDDELAELAARGELRKNFRAQVQRMLADPKARAFSENFASQWLQTRAVLDVPINSAVVMASEAAPAATEGAASTNTAPALVGVASTPAANTNPPAALAPDALVAGGPPGLGRGGRRGNLAGRGRGGFGFGRGRRAAPGTELTPEIRAAMKQEADAYFHHIVREDRSVLELLQSNSPSSTTSSRRFMAFPMSPAPRCAASNCRLTRFAAAC